MRKRILMIDDEPDYVDMIKMRLEAGGYEVLTAADGPDGLSRALAEKPDLILLDVMMPGMDGCAVLKRLRQQDETRPIPVVMLTSKGESKAIFQSQKLGAVDHLVKPCESGELLRIVSRHA